jgi:hypothetical protein
LAPERGRRGFEAGAAGAGWSAGRARDVPHEATEEIDMRFLFTVIDDGQAAAAGDNASASAAEMAAIDLFNARIQASGQLIAAHGLAAPATATVVDARGDAAIVTAGSFDEGASFAAGFWIVDADDEHAARTLAHDASRACNRRIEVRGLQ